MTYTLNVLKKNRQVEMISKLSINSISTLFIRLLGVAFFGTLFWFALIFFKERMLTADPAFFSFRIIQDRSYDIELHRLGSAVSQVLPLILLKLGCTLEVFLKAYSVSFILIYYLIFLILTEGLKNYRAGIALIITLCLTFRHAFYYSTAELYQGMALCILIWALIIKMKEVDTKKKKNILFICSSILIFVVSYYHQLTLFALLFILIFEILNGNSYKDQWLIPLLAITGLWFFVRINFLTTTNYESGKIPTIAVFKEQLPHIRNLPSYIFFKQFTKAYLLPFVIVMFVSGFILLKRKNWLLIFFIPIYIAGFILLDVITYYKGESPIMYENYLTLLGLFAAVAFCGLIEIRPSMKWQTGFCLIVIFWSTTSMYASHYPFSNRVAYLQRLTDEGRKHAEKKYIIDQRNFPWQYAWVDWTLPFETLLYSSLPGRDSSITVMSAENIHQYDSLLNMKDVFLGPRWAITWFWSNSLSKGYFKLPETGYKKLASLQSDSSFNESVYTKENVAILPLQREYITYQDSNIVIPVIIKNGSGHKINSIPDVFANVKLSYHIYDNNNKQIKWDGVRTPLELDVENEIQQGLVVEQKLRPGKYIIEADIVSENKRWWNLNSRSILIIK